MKRLKDTIELEKETTRIAKDIAEIAKDIVETAKEIKEKNIEKTQFFETEYDENKRKSKVNCSFLEDKKKTIVHFYESDREIINRTEYLELFEEKTDIKKYYVCDSDWKKTDKVKTVFYKKPKELTFNFGVASRGLSLTIAYEIKKQNKYSSKLKMIEEERLKSTLNSILTPILGQILEPISAPDKKHPDGAFSIAINPENFKDTLLSKLEPVLDDILTEKNNLEHILESQKMLDSISELREEFKELLLKTLSPEKLESTIEEYKNSQLTKVTFYDSSPREEVKFVEEYENDFIKRNYYDKSGNIIKSIFFKISKPEKIRTLDRTEEYKDNKLIKTTHHNVTNSYNHLHASNEMNYTFPPKKR